MRPIEVPSQIPREGFIMICNTDKQPALMIPFNQVHDITLDTHLNGPSIYSPYDGPHEAE